MRMWGWMVVPTGLLFGVATAFGQAEGQQRGQQGGQVQQQGSMSPRVVVKTPPAVRERLDALGFAALPGTSAEPLATIYRRWSLQDHLPLVVTSDAAMHTCHLYFDWYLRFLETAYLRDDLVNLDDALAAKMMELADTSKDKKVREAALADAAYFVIGKRLLTGAAAGGGPAPWDATIESELKQVRAGEGFAKSPLFGYMEDYSQYKPRGHYARSETLQGYFRAAMWHGRMTFRYGGDDGMEQTRRAMLLARGLEECKVKGETAQAVLKRIYETTAFFAGRSDDLTPTDYSVAMGKGMDPASDKDVEQVMDRVKALRKPQILGGWEVARATGGPDFRESTGGMRLLGQRCVVDSFITQKLVFASVGEYTGDPEGATKPLTLVNARGMWVRGFPRGLDVMAALGFAQAGTLLGELGDSRYAGYDKMLAGVSAQVAAMKPSEWQADLHHIRLAALGALARTPAGVLPEAMKTKEWGLKQLTAALGSWTELRHDNILYSKQPYSMSQSVMFAGVKGTPPPPPPPPPRGYVEPVPEVYKYLRVAVESLTVKMKTLGYPEDKALSGFLQSFTRSLRTLEDISEKELAGKVLTDEEHHFIEDIGARFRLPREGLPHYTDVDREFRDAMDDQMAVVADVHTDSNSKEVLEEGVGRPWILYMVCPVDGKPTVCIGVVYSYYEFRRPMGERLTDEAWRWILSQDKAPAPASWMDAYTAKGR